MLGLFLCHPDKHLEVEQAVLAVVGSIDAFLGVPSLYNMQTRQTASR